MKSEMMMKLEQMIVNAGGTVSSGGSWEDEQGIYVSSKECFGSATYGHPRYSASYNKETGWVVPPKGPAYKA